VSTIRAAAERGGHERPAGTELHGLWSPLVQRQAIHLGQGEALIDLALPAGFGSDLPTYGLHPALLDMATGAAQKLIPGFAGDDDFYVPFSYGRVLVTRPLPPTFSSHVRLRVAEGKSVVFDVTLLDEEGNELVSIERYIMRRVEAFASIPASSKPARPDGPETAEEGFLREGMTNAEGLEALDRILACNVSPQVAASTLDLDLWLDRLEHGGRGTPAEDANWSIGTPGLVRPGGDAGVRPPRDSLERDLAAIWKEMLGVQQVSIDDDFFELGGQSLIAMRLFNRIRKEHGIELSLSVLFQAPTIAATAELLREAKGLAAIDPGEAVDGPSRRATRSLSAACTEQAAGNIPSQRTPSSSLRRPHLGRDHTGGHRPPLSAFMAPEATCLASATSRGSAP
jgi:aryl carrier-like protein